MARRVPGIFVASIVALSSMLASMSMAQRAVAGGDISLAHNVAADPSFTAACSTNHGRSRKCIQLAVLAIERARSMEPMKQYALILPDDFRHLTLAQQTFVVIDLERVDRGLRPIEGLVPAFNQSAQDAAADQADPSPPMSQLAAAGVRQYRTLWARADGALASDYEWMYDDGYSPDGDLNVNCNAPDDAGCWSHRRAILAPFARFSRLLAGAGSADASGGYDSVTAILTGGSGPSPQFTYTWREALIHGADGQVDH